MSKDQPVTEQDRADLVAFLDGELTGEAARAMEARLSLDPKLRAEAESFKKTWELLDFLPRSEPSPSFTEKTLSRIDPLRKTGKAPRRSEPSALGRVLLAAGAWVALLMMGAVAGYAGFRAAFPREPGEKELLRDLRLIENKRHYDRIDDFDFLEKLDHPDLFGEGPGH